MSIKQEQDGLMDYLFSKTKRGVLEMLFRQPEKSFYTNEIVRQVGTGTGAVQKELKEIAAAGLAIREKKGNLVLYKANQDSHFFEELNSMMAKVTTYSLELKAKSLELRTKNSDKITNPSVHLAKLGRELRTGNLELTSHKLQVTSRDEKTLKAKNWTKENVGGFCRKNHVKKMSLFGEVLKDNFRPESGIDVLVEFEAGHQPGAFELSDLEDQLSGLAGSSVKLHNAADMIGFAREEAEGGGVVIFDECQK